MSLTEDIVDAILGGRVSNQEDLQRLKSQLCEKYSLSRMPSNPEILSGVAPDKRALVEPLLRIKPVRSLSGVSVVAVMASPEKCPHGRCIYCPGGPEMGTAQSYTGFEPAARRAASHSFDPYDQVRSRLDQLRETGHPVDKIDLILMGGTLPARSTEYQTQFVKRCFDAMNGRDSGSVEDAQILNESAPSRCIGMTVETRPDQLSGDQIEFLMRLGMTRAEIGVQTVFDDVLRRLERGHSVRDSIDATQRAKSSGLKVCYHLMPGLPGSDLERDIELFRTIFADPAFRPDMLKIYPTLVIAGTKLFDMWKRGEYEPPDTEYIVELLSKVKPGLPRWVRVQRIQRDIPVPQISAGALHSNARQLVAERMRERGQRCSCIRCREVGHAIEGIEQDDCVKMSTRYESSGGTEHFLEITNFSADALVAFARLRIDDPDGEPIATVRELRVYGQHVPIALRVPDGFQHRGHGKTLLEWCENLAAESGAGSLRITSGIGVRGYYRRLGYELSGSHMVKTVRSR